MLSAETITPIGLSPSTLKNAWLALNIPNISRVGTYSLRYTIAYTGDLGSGLPTIPHWTPRVPLCAPSFLPELRISTLQLSLNGPEPKVDNPPHQCWR